MLPADDPEPANEHEAVDDTDESLVALASVERFQLGVAFLSLCIRCPRR